MTVVDLRDLEDVQGELLLAFEKLGELSCRQSVSPSAKRRLDATIDRQIGEIRRLQKLEADLLRGKT